MTLMMEAAGTSETSVNFYQTTRRNNLEDSHLHKRRYFRIQSFLEGLLHLDSAKVFFCTILKMIKTISMERTYEDA
jgi:hypothetical protein